MSGRVSMRSEYDSHGVEKYYKEHGLTYRNPHFPDLVKVISSLMDAILPLMIELKSSSKSSSFESHSAPCFRLSSIPSSSVSSRTLRILDLACGSGEAAIIIKSWFTQNQRPPFDELAIFATDAYTKAAYEDRTGWPCMTHSFVDISNGAFQDFVDVCFCSFALHLAEESLLFSLLYEVARKCRFFIVISPHKRPIIKENGHLTLLKTIVQCRIHVRVFKSLIFEDDQ